ncbi:MAG: hypothetical protein J5730_02350 [Bacteroidales bacterium]|nr:hypothetical protein [Bacteroidales bacterium]
MKRIFLIITILLAGIVVSNAQENKIDGNKMVQERLTNMKAQFKPSATEAKTFWKAYEEFLRSEVKLHETYRSNLEKKGITVNCPNCAKCDEKCNELTDAQITYLFDQKFELKKSMFNLESSFYKKMKSTLSAKHLQEFYKMDERVKRDLISKQKSNTAAKTKDATKAKEPTPTKPKR